MENTQQKLGRRNTFTPADASLVCSSVAVSLNREETLGEHGLKTFSNSLEENLPQHTGGPKANVYVLNKNTKPLMPCKPAKARKLLKQGKAKVVKRDPFVIQLLWNCEHKTQDITLGIDSGYTNVGFSAVTEKEELISGELTLRSNVSKKLEERRMYRRNRRNRLWNRKPRFLNRKKKEGWLAPSILHKLDTHVRLIEQLKQILPVTETVIEVATFDTQKMQKPEISGKEYQQGTLQGYEVREYLLEKWNRQCAYCGKKDIPLEIDHIIPKARKRDNRVSNLTLACRGCNQKKNQQTAEEFGFPKLQKKAQEPLKQTAFMNIVRKILTKQIGAKETYGYVTKHDRIQLGLEKSHVNDAFVIASGAKQERCKSYQVKQSRRNNRSLQKNRKGFARSIRRQRYALQPNDSVLYWGERHFVKGVHCKGSRVVLDAQGSVAIKKVELLYYGKGLQFQQNRGSGFSSPHQECSVSKPQRL